MASSEIKNVGDLRALIANLPDNLPVKMAYENPYGNNNRISRVRAAEAHDDGVYLYEEA